MPHASRPAYLLATLAVLVLAFFVRVGFDRATQGRVAKGAKPVHRANAGELRDALANRGVLCVGCTAGLGEAIAERAAEAGAKVVVVGRRQSAHLRDRAFHGTGSVRHVTADLSSMKEAARLAKELMRQERFSYIMFTVGILAPPTRDESTEGIEIDLAVSYLSRLVFAANALPQLWPISPQRHARVFVMGFPGTTNTFNIDVANLNSDTKPYSAWGAHELTIAGNEALVKHLAAKFEHRVDVFGLNPGLIPTDIRANITGGSGTLTHAAVEGLISALAPTPKDYARVVVDLMASADLGEKHLHPSGTSFNQRGVALMDSLWIEQDPSLARKLIDASVQLVKAKAGDGVLPASFA